ncbi:FAD-binding domain-containing protein [Plectosphaerella plurivora]|uniref:FAD-binding domain-containing protein n=1 Tax=Plectosphaerella plurivora TaxID=936078 RepID=A0A9P8VNE7_9PEZI|nr:FAD-binding domain-containing protein [Plectosphaerella plurivora]
MATSTTHPAPSAKSTTTLPDDAVLIIGAGPVGLMTASVLAYYGVGSVVLERNNQPTKYPKMDLTNARSMELLRKIGLAAGLRKLGVPSEIPYTVLMTTGLSQNAPFTRWNHPSVDEYQDAIRSKNDGTQPLEPYQRVSQQLFESWLRDLSKKNPLIDLRYEHKLESFEETTDGVKAQVTSPDAGSMEFQAKFAVACDGASSRSRSNLNIPLDGGPMPFKFLLIHFKSRDLRRLHKQGWFWHLFSFDQGAFGGAVISQDEKDTFTVHFGIPPGTGEATIGSEEAVYRVLGGLHGPFQIQIDEILLRSTYQPSTATAKSFAGSHLRAFLAGDSAHQNIPTGGYGMNTGIGDAFDIGWKLAAVVNGYGGQGLLRSYEQERLPIATQNVKRAAEHMGAHMAAVGLLGSDASEINKDSGSGQKLRAALEHHYQVNNGENTDLGVEMGYRYVSGVCVPDDHEPEPQWDPHTYLPTTWPGSRAPHVFLNDGLSIFDRLGRDYTLVEFFAPGGLDTKAGLLSKAAEELGVPLAYVPLTGEENAAKIWEKRLVLVRPDGHVAWRGDSVENGEEASRIINTVVGRLG